MFLEHDVKGRRHCMERRRMSALYTDIQDPELWDCDNFHALASSRFDAIEFML